MSKTSTSDQEGVAQPIRDREHFQFSVPSEGIAVVTNNRHDEPTTYAVNIAQTGETSACSCPADEHHPGACKHRQAVESEPCVLIAATSEPRQ